jgi:hypothetical protein
MGEGRTDAAKAAVDPWHDTRVPHAPGLDEAVARSHHSAVGDSHVRYELGGITLDWVGA